MRALGAPAPSRSNTSTASPELQDSRERIVAAGDDERRRLERNLHDGAQQRLVSVALQLRLLRTASARTRPRCARQRAQLRARGVAGRAARLDRGIHPSVLDHGLDGALESLTTRSQVPTRSTRARTQPARAGRARRLLRRVRGADQRRQVRAGVDGLGHGHTSGGPAADPDRRRRVGGVRRRRLGPARPRRPCRRARRAPAGPQSCRARNGRDRRAPALSANARRSARCATSTSRASGRARRAHARSPGDGRNSPPADSPRSQK